MIEGQDPERQKAFPQLGGKELEKLFSKEMNQFRTEKFSRDIRSYGWDNNFKIGVKQTQSRRGQKFTLGGI